MANTIITISVVLISVFVFLIFFFLRKAKQIKSKKIVKEKRKGVDFEAFQEAWQGVLTHLNANNESDWKLAIIEADKLAGNLLIQKGFKGESMAERLAGLEKDELRSLDLLWEAHKIRNRIAHKTGFKLSHQEATRAVSYYKEALEELMSSR